MKKKMLGASLPAPDVERNKYREFLWHSVYIYLYILLYISFVFFVVVVVVVAAAAPLSDSLCSSSSSFPVEYIRNE